MFSLNFIVLKHPKHAYKCIHPFILHRSFLNHPMTSKSTITFLLLKVCASGSSSPLPRPRWHRGAGRNPQPLYIYKLKKAGVEDIQCDCASVPLQKALRKDPRQGTTKMKAIDQLPHATHAYIPPFRAGELIHSYL